LGAYPSFTVHAGKGEEKCIPSLVGEPEGKRQLGRPKRRWGDDIKMDPKGI
jgi:hypothetical protein